MGTYYFNGSSKELLRQDYFVGATLAKRGVIKTFTGSVAFSALFTAPTSCLSSSASKWRCKALFKCN